MPDAELELFKTYDLRLIAASYGYVIDKRASSRGSTVMRRGEHEKLIVARKPDGHYTYWSPHDDRDKGTVIDFVQKRTGFRLGGVRVELRKWASTPSPAALHLPELASSHKDFGAIRARYVAMPVAHRHAYLENERAIPAELLASRRFAGRIRVDGHGAAIFPHTDADGILCGYEVKNSGFTGFSSGGRKGLWLSNTSPDDLRLVITEASIDSLSHAALFPDPDARYGSVGGKTTAAQLAMLRAVFLAMPAHSEIVAASDADESGHALGDTIRRLVMESGRKDLTYRRDEPSAKDFNEVLKVRRRPMLPSRRRDEPSVP